MFFSITSGRFMHSVLVGLVCLAIASSCSTIMCLENERDALLQFKQGLVDAYNVLASWESKNNCCDWRGIACNNQTGHVTTLDLSITKDARFSNTAAVPLRGEISPSLLELQYLNYLDLSFNDFGGMVIPEFIGSMSQLKVLILAEANFSGHVPPQLGNLSALHTLDLSRNDFEGNEIPKFIGSLSQLKELKLVDANFSGHVPPHLGNLSNLQSLDLYSYNQDVSSENLEWLSHLSSLRYLNMSWVDLSEAVNWPQSLSKLTSLRELRLSSCDLPDVNLSSSSFINSSTSLQLLYLSFNNLNSSIVYWIANVSTNLVHIGLSANNLEGPIPNVFTGMLSLVTIDLSWNNLEGGIPKGFENLCSLEWLNLGGNQLSGNIEDSIKALSCAKNTLETLHLGNLAPGVGNQFWGSIPELTGFSKLTALSLSWNKLNGPLPESVLQRSSLEYLSLGWNSMTGVITESLFQNLSRLQVLDLYCNGFSINISSDWNPPFQLTGRLRISTCKLGPAIPKWILKQTNTTEFDLINAGISGSLPDKFWDLSPRLGWLDLSRNQIRGELPNLSTTRLGLMLNLSSNLLSGAVPSLPPRLLGLDLSNNMFSELSTSFCASRAPDLRSIVISDNLLSGELPNCWMQFATLQLLDLGNNELSGKIPSSLGNLKSMMILRLKNNNFSRELPSLTNCTQLVTVDLGNNNLSGKIPTWIGQSLTNLVVLRLHSNQFSGIIPFSLCNLAFIHVLDLSHNNISGGLPHCLNNITSFADDDITDIINIYTMDVELIWKGIQREFGNNLGQLRSIDISSNSLVAEIPESITSMEKLKSLNLSGNNLMGKLPHNFGNIKMLESLDLSRNQISGGIPASFSKLNFLSVLDLSHNNLSGRIPLGTQLQSFNASAYMGNLGLCGPPLTPNCSGNGTTLADDDIKEHENDGLISLGFIISTVLGFVSGFWIVSGGLMLKSSWRYAYFKFLDDSRDWIYVKTVVYKAKILRRLQR